MIKVNPYRKKDGNIVLYVNNYQNKVNVCIGQRVFTTKLTKGQDNLLSTFFKKLQEYCEKEKIENFESSLNHDEEQAVLDFDLKFFITDKATICGVKVEKDGGYILFENKLINLEDFNHFLNENEK